MDRARQKPNEPTWNEVKALFESLRNDIGILAEEIRGLSPRLVNLERRLDALEEEFKTFKVALFELRKDMSEFRKDVTGQLHTIDERLASAETKLPS